VTSEGRLYSARIALARRLKGLLMASSRPWWAAGIGRCGTDCGYANDSGFAQRESPAPGWVSRAWQCGELKRRPASQCDNGAARL